MDESKQTQKSEAINIKIFYGLTWDEPLTEDRRKYIKATFGPLAKNLIELAGLVRESCVKYRKAGEVSNGDIRWIEVDKNTRLIVSVDKWGTLIRTFASAKRLRQVIESVSGGERQAKEFYQQIITAISGHDFRFSKIMTNAVLSSESRGENQNQAVTNFQVDFFRETLSNAKECNVETIAKTLESWQEQSKHITRSKKIQDSARIGGRVKAQKASEIHKEILKDYQGELPRHAKIMGAVRAVATKHKKSPRQVQRIISKQHK